jgi:AcrR family transcriptional regulator
VSGSTKARIKQSPKRPAEERRRELLDAARSLFLKNGYRETSMDDIARKAGLTKGALYFHFSNKDDILIQLVKSFHVEIVAKIRVLPTRKSSPVDVLRILLEAQHGHGKAPFERFLDIRKFMGAGMSRPFQKAFAEVVDPAYAATPRDRRDLAVMVAAAAEGLGVRQLMGDPEINIPRQLKMLSAMIENLRNENKRTR